MIRADTPCWFVYLIECADGRLYAGITNDLAARFAKHASGKGAAFMRMSKPLRYVAVRPFPSRGEAASAEAALKKLPRTDKLAWAAANPAGQGTSAKGVRGASG